MPLRTFSISFSMTRRGMIYFVYEDMFDAI